MRPRQSDAAYDEYGPTDLDRLNFRNIESGFVFFETASGKTIRKFIDLNKDDKLDTWIYFKDGVETYRDMDLDFNGKVDQCQYINGDEIRYGIDEDEDGEIDRWGKGTLSDLKRN